MEWTKKEVLDFVDFYKLKTILWDPRHPDYHSRADKNLAWEEVAQEMGRTVDDCRRKMEYLLSALRREKQKIKKTIGVGKEAFDSYKSKWYPFDSLRFLLDKSNQHGNSSSMEGDIREGLSEEECEETLHELLIPDYESNVESTSAPTMITVPVNPRKRRAMQYDVSFDTPLETLKPADDLNDDCQLFGSLVAAKLRKLNEDVKTCLQSEIMALFVKASRGFFSHPSNSQTVKSEQLEAQL